MSPDLRLLLARVEQARGPDEELDRALSAAIQDDGNRRGRTPPGERIRPYTSSLDATLDLMQRVLPRWAVEACRYGCAGGARATIWPEGLRPEISHDGSAATLPLAVLAAVLKSRIADGRGGDAAPRPGARPPIAKRDNVVYAWPSAEALRPGA